MSIGNIDKQEFKALVLLVKEIMDQIDEVAALRRKGFSASLSLELLKEMCSIVKDLTPDLKTTYFDLLIKLSDKMPPSFRRANVSEEYVDHTAKIRRRFVSQIRLDLKLTAA